MYDRLERLNAWLGAHGPSAALVLRGENIRYLTGYTGEGWLLVGGDRPVILTDSRYVEQAGIQAPGCACACTSPGSRAGDLVREALHSIGAKALATELDFITVRSHEALAQALAGIEISDLAGAIARMRAVKSAEEIDEMVRACEIACRAFDEVLPLIRPGISERDVAIELDYRMLRLGAERVAFDTVAAGGPNGSLPHWTPSDRAIQMGELLTLDFGAQVNGYQCDMTRTVAIGAPADELRRVYDAVLTAQTRALELVAPGAKCRDIDRAARIYLDERYPGAFGHSLGHGVGLETHELPNLSARSGETLEVGNVVTVEPGVYISGLGGCRIEDMVIVTEAGYVNPITTPKGLIIL